MGYNMLNSLEVIKSTIKKLEKKGLVLYPMTDSELIGAFGNAFNLIDAIENESIAMNFDQW